MKIKTILIIVACLVASVYFWIWRMKQQHKVDTATASTVLSPTDNEKIVIDPDSHRITVITANGIKKEFLPGMRPSSITIKKDGSVTVVSPQWGVEHGIFMGGGVANDGLRFGGGLDLLYYHRFDLGLFITDLTKDLTKVRLGLALSYTVWHETRLTVGIDHTSSVNILLTERF